MATRALLCFLMVAAAGVAWARPDDGKHGGKGKETKPPADIEVTEPGPLPPYYGPLRRAIVSAMEVKVQGVTTTAPTPSGTTTVVTLDIQQPTDFGTGLADMLTTALIASKRFVVLERLNADEIQKERALTQAADFDAATTVKPGRMLGAQVAIRGAVTELALKRSGSGVGGILGDTVAFSRARSEATVAIDLKLVEVATGQVLDSVRAEGKAVSKAQSFQLTTAKIKFGDASFQNSPLGLAVRSAINDGVHKICDRMGKLPWQARIAAVIDGPPAPVIYLNVGKDSGLQKGDVLDVAHPGVDIVDPDTRLVIGKAKATHVGRCRVDQVQEKLTTVAPMDGSGFQAEDVVTFIERPGAPVAR